ncbi:MAG: GNAT family protein [Kineosporiaceae bacterium]
MELTYEPLRREDAAALGAFLSAHPWPFHAGGRPDAEDVARRVRAGEFDGPDVRTTWVLLDGLRCGVVRAFDLEDATPLFDLRLAEDARGQGIGTRVVAWLAHELFTSFAHVQRVEATTRADNAAMRALLRANGFVKEAHYRRAWPAEGAGRRARPHDAVGYALLREDWRTGERTPVEWDDEP